MGKEADRLRNAVFRDSEVLRSEPLDEAAFAIVNADGGVDEVRLGLVGKDPLRGGRHRSGAE